MAQAYKPIDVKALLSNKKRAYDFILDGTHFGRGDSYVADFENSKYEYRVVSLKKWKVRENENSLKDVTDAAIEHFYSNECYVVYVKFDVTVSNLSTGGVVQKTDDDGVREIYFYWRGLYASKGYSPLPKELNVEDVPVERTYQWTELPVFLRLFNGKLIVHNKTSAEAVHLYMLCGTVKEEANFIEVPKEKRSLRSRTSFLLVLPHERKIYVWYGSKAYNKDFFGGVLSSLQENASSVYGTDNKAAISVTAVNERENDEEFLAHLNGGPNDYFTLVNDSFGHQHSPRLFYLNNITGEFAANEIEYTLGSEFLNPFPFLQDHLYTAPQPALFLLDNGQELWLWQGWKTETTTEGALLEFEEQREWAIETAINYWREKHADLKERIYLVAAGLEPLAFVNLFPFWTPKNNLKESFIGFNKNEKFHSVSTEFLS